MPVVLAIFPVIEGVHRADEFFNIVFFAVLLSTLLQGTTIEPVARWLGVTTDEPRARARRCSRSAPCASSAPTSSST